MIFLEDITSGKRSFLLAKNRLVNKNLELKSIPCLELQTIVLGVETLMDVYNELSGADCVVPVNIEELKYFSDSSVCLSWLHSYFGKFEKMNKKSVCVMNRLNTISVLCDKFPVEFGFCAGCENPADAITRPMSYRQLIKTNYFSGPDVSETSGDVPTIIVPNPLMSCDQDAIVSQLGTTEQVTEKKLKYAPLINVQNVSSLSKIINIYRYVLKFINVLKLRGKQVMHEATYDEALHKLILCDQHEHFGGLFVYFNSKTKTMHA